MRVLRLGYEGDDVTAWQNFLRGIWKDNDLIVNGIFDEKTVSVTKFFQKIQSLSADGVVGRLTLAKALLCGFDPMIDNNDDMTSSSWPPCPSDVVNMPWDKRQAIFGTFSYVSEPQRNNPEAIRITDNWVSENIVSVCIPEISTLVSTVQLHKLIAPQVQRLFTAWDAAGFIDRIVSWDGAWVPRYVRGSRTYLSNHSWGTAFDINARWNGLGVQPALIDEPGSVRELVQIANEHGMFWGGHFAKRPDGMHFECYKLIP